MRSFWTTADLLARGKSEREIRRAIEQGRLIPVRRGLVAVPGTSELLLRGTGRRRRDLRDRCGRARTPDAAGSSARAGSCAPASSGAPVGSGVAPVLTMLEHAFLSLSPEHALAVLDSALHHRFLRVGDLPALADRLPSRLRPVVMAADGRADSGIETITRHLLRLLGLRVLVHSVLDGIGEVDLLVEGRLIVELDGKEFHSDDDAFERDRHRDLVAATSRYRSLRCTWRTVLFEWPSVEAAVLAALAA